MQEAEVKKKWVDFDVVLAVLVLSGLESFFFGKEDDFQRFFFWAKTNRRGVEKLLEDFIFNPWVAVTPYSSNLAKAMTELFISGSLESIKFQGQEEYLHLLNREEFLKEIPELFSDEEILILQKLANDFINYELIHSFRGKVWEESRGQKETLGR